jgi:hypothetical protein
MIYSSNVSDKNTGYGILLACLRQKQGVWYNVSEKKKGYGILLECLTEKQGLWYILRMSQTQTRGMMYSSNISHTNKIYSLKFYEKHKVDDIFPRMSHSKTRVMICSLKF